MVNIQLLDGSQTTGLDPSKILDFFMILLYMLRVKRKKRGRIRKARMLKFTLFTLYGIYIFQLSFKLMFY